MLMKYDILIKLSLDLGGLVMRPLQDTGRNRLNWYWGKESQQGFHLPEERDGKQDAQIFANIFMDISHVTEYLVKFNIFGKKGRLKNVLHLVLAGCFPAPPPPWGLFRSVQFFY